MEKFTKDDLQVNDIVTTRAGNSYIVHNFNGELFAIRELGYLAFDEHNNDLTLKQDAEFDIVKVQRPNGVYQLMKKEWIKAPVIWKRKEKEKVHLLSEAEYHILKNANAQWKWIARDKDKCLVLYRTKPYKKSVYWYNGDIVVTTLDMYNHLFSHIKWGDDKPREIAKLLERYEEEHNHGN